MTRMDINQKTRQLKKYEAQHSPVLVSEQGTQYFSPFGPLIAKFKIPATIIDTLNDYADGICEENLGSEFMLPAEVVFNGGEHSLAGVLESSIAEYVETVDHTPVKQVQLNTAWIVSQYESTASPVHFHSCDISGVLYLRVPEISSQQDERNYISGRREGFINFLSGGKQTYSKSLISFPPVVGDCYIFPAWLLHGVEPFDGSGERRSAAFNADVFL